MQHLVRHRKGVLEGGVGVGDQEQILVRDDDQRVDMLLQFGNAFFRGAHALGAFKAERLGDDTNRQYALFARSAGHDWGCARAGAAAHAGGDEAHVRAIQRGFELLKRFLGGSTADFRAGAGAQALCDLHAKLDAGASRAHGQLLGIGVGDHELHAHQIGGDHVGHRIAAGTADTNDSDTRLQFGQFWLGEFQHVVSPEVRCILDDARIAGK